MLPLILTAGWPVTLHSRLTCQQRCRPLQLQKLSHCKWARFCVLLKIGQVSPPASPVFIARSTAVLHPG